VYEFLLYGGAAQELLSSVTVTKNGMALWSAVSARELDKEGAFIEASPNPVPDGPDYAKTTINWNTGDGSKGVIHVAMKNLQMRYPVDGAEAIEQLEAFRAKGGEFLLVPRRLLSWLDAFPGLKDHLDWHYPLIQDDENCRIYDIRKTEAERRSAS